MPVGVSQIVEREVPPSIKLVGSILPDKSATVAAEVAGLIASFDAEEGQFLDPGDVICRIDDTVARLRLAEATATLEQLKARLAELENGARAEDLRRLEAAVAEEEALLEKAEFEQRRILDLYERGQSNDKEKIDAEMDYLAAKRRLAQARAQLEKAQNGARPEVIAAARSAVSAQQATVQRLQRDVEKTSIRAPFKGAITEKHTEVGEWINAGGDVCAMVAVETVRVRVDVPEHAIRYARANAPTTIEIEALRATRSASITRVIPLATQAARTFPIEIDLENTTHELLPGMFVRAYVPSGPLSKRLMTTKDAIVARGTSKQVFVIRPGQGDGSSIAMPVSVKTGLELQGLIEIQGQGLSAGDRVVSRANERLYGPQPVIPQQIAEAPTTQAAARSDANKNPRTLQTN